MVALGLAASPARAADPVIAAAGDIACSPSHAAFNNGNGTATECRQMYTSDLVLNNPLFSGTSAVLALGDIQYETGSLASFQASYDPSWGRLKSMTRPVIGNHEGLGAGYYEYFNGQGAGSGPAGPTGVGYYSFDVGAWHLIALNTNCQDVGGCHTGSPQERWLDADLAANPTSCTLAYWHEAVFSSQRPSTVAKPFLQRLYARGADLVLTGHAHTYERFAPQTPDAAYDNSHGIREIIVGTGGRSLRPFGPSVAFNSEARLDTAFGVLKLTLHPTSYEWQFVSESGQVEDSGIKACHGSPPAAPTRSQSPSPSKAPSKSPSGVSHIPADECTVLGTAGADVLMGTRGHDVICGRGGNDVIHGAAGNDLISGGSGQDTVRASAGRDRIFGDRGNDRLLGGNGRDRINGGPGRDRLFGDAGNDRLWDSAGNDLAYGGPGNDVFVSGQGSDLVDGGQGRDRARVSGRDWTLRVELFGPGGTTKPPSGSHHAHHH